MKDDQDGIWMVLAPLDGRKLAGPILPRCTKKYQDGFELGAQIQRCSKNDLIDILEMMRIRPVES